MARRVCPFLKEGNFIFLFGWTSPSGREERLCLETLGHPVPALD